MSQCPSSLSTLPGSDQDLIGSLYRLVFFAQLGLAIWSLFPSPSHRAEREEKRRARESRWAHLDSPTTESKVPGISLEEVVNSKNHERRTSAGASNPMTPRTLAFNRLGGTRDLPLRNHFGFGSKDKEGTPKSSFFPSRFALRSPTFPASPLSPGFDSETRKLDEENPGEPRNGGTPGTTMYFPPPPKAPTSSGR